MNGKAISASQSQLDRDIYKEGTDERSKNVSGDIWDDEEVETLPSTQGSRLSTSSTQREVFVEKPLPLP